MALHGECRLPGIIPGNLTRGRHCGRRHHFLDWLLPFFLIVPRRTAEGCKILRDLDFVPNEGCLGTESRRENRPMDDGRGLGHPVTSVPGGSDPRLRTSLGPRPPAARVFQRIQRACGLFWTGWRDKTKSPATRPRWPAVPTTLRSQKRPYRSPRASGLPGHRRRVCRKSGPRVHWSRRTVKPFGCGLR